MNWYVVVVALIAGWLRGMAEGMRMSAGYDNWHRIVLITDNGVRNHTWFRWYHAISTAVILSFMLLGAQLYHNLTMIPLALFLIWEAYETAYPWTRWGVFINRSAEHITFIDLISLHYHSGYMHLFRWSFIVVLTWRII